MSFDSQLLIDGQLRGASSGKTFAVINPVTGEEAGRAPDATPEDMDAAISAARRAFDETDWSTNHELRLKCIKQLYDALVAETDRIKAGIVAETGAPLGICGPTGPQCEVPISLIKHTLEFLPTFQWRQDMGVTEMMGRRSQRYVEKEAIGVVACITPWNVPMQINLAKCIPALAAGCTVVLKPAPETPWSAYILGKLVKEKTDMPDGVFNVVMSEDPKQVGDQLVGDPRVDMVSFTGSTQTGKHIMARASQTVKKVFLELGGKSANIILDDADLKRALLSALGVCFHAGQGCAITTRLLVPRERQEEAAALLKAYFSRFPYGDPGSEEQIMGPLISARQRKRVLDYIRIGIDEGATLLLGGGIPEGKDKGYYVEPTVFTDVTNDMTIAREEIFGPVLVVIAYDDEEDAIRIANDSDFGLSGGVWSADEQRAMAVARRIRAGTITVNGGNYYAADMPFGGYKQSGIGREMGREGFEEYLESKSIAVGR